MEINWPVFATIIGTVTALLTWLYTMLKKPNVKTEENIRWKTLVDKEHEIIHEQIKSIKEEAENLRQLISASDERTAKTLEKFEAKIEKFTDIIIDYIKKKD